MKKIIIAMLILCAAALGFYAVKTYLNNRKYNQAGFAYGNGRLEATEISIASKLAGRLEEVYVDEGDFVQKGQKLALTQLNVLNAELAQAKAKLLQAEAKLKESEAQVNVKQGELISAKAVVSQKQSTLDGAKKRYDRAKGLLKDDAVSKQTFETDETYYLTSKSELDAAEAAIPKYEAAVAAAQAEVAASSANIAAAQAEVDRVQADIDDSVLTAPLKGRIQYRIAQPGEVLNSGSFVLNMVDLTDVYMTFFLPEETAGKVRIGAPVRIVLDAIPDVPIPASITFVSSVAQFTPKTVETKEERQKLMFRVKAKIAPELLEKYIEYIKTGLPGVAWVQINPEAKWPEFLMLKNEREQQSK